ncbi:MAG: DUF1513 domain-containing protein [Pseudomonadota bacterium]
MQSRRGFLRGALATAALPATSWASVGNPSHLSAAQDPSGDYALYGLREDGTRAFRVSLPQRGHAAAAHPSAPEAVAFARRPGTFALVLDCSDGHVQHRLDAPEGHHFYGHGAFSADGAFLFTTENHVATGRGIVGVWDRASGYARIDQISSHGIGPHEIIRMPDGGLAVANGGIRTHPDTGRQKLNLETMRPNLAILDRNGRLSDLADVPGELHMNSLRHISVQAQGRVACGFQWQGDPFDTPALLAIYGAQGLEFIEFEEGLSQRMKGYIGSVGWLDTRQVLVSSPRGGLLINYDSMTGASVISRLDDVCGVAASTTGGLATDGLGRLHAVSGKQNVTLASYPLAFDNHLIRIGTA